MIALTRKNALFAGHDGGAAAWARIASLIGTCRVNGVDPYGYMNAVLEAIAAGHHMELRHRVSRSAQGPVWAAKGVQKAAGRCHQGRRTPQILMASLRV